MCDMVLSTVPVSRSLASWASYSPGLTFSCLVGKLQSLSHVLLPRWQATVPVSRSLASWASCSPGLTFSCRMGKLQSLSHVLLPRGQATVPVSRSLASWASCICLFLVYSRCQSPRASGRPSPMCVPLSVEWVYEWQVLRSLEV